MSDSGLPSRPSALAIIPARGGSKGVTRKNVRPLAGRPLLVHTIEQALAAERVGRVIVSTDDAEIERVAEAHGAEVIERPAELADDDAPSESALVHVLDQLAEREGYRPELVVFLQCTSPIRDAADIDRAICQLLEEGADSLLSAVPFHGFTWRRGSTGAEPLNYDHRQRPRRQDRKGEYLENGSIYVFKRSILRRHGNRLGGKIALYEMDPASAVDIDRLEDFDICEALLRARAARAERKGTP